MPAGDRKIPDPIVEPMSTATALNSPRRRGSRESGSAENGGSSMAHNTAMTARRHHVVCRLARHPLRGQLSRIIPTFASDVIFWLAALCCALSQIAIVRSALRARALRPDGTAAPARAIEVAWTVVPGLLLIVVLLFTWRALHPAPTILIVP